MSKEKNYTITIKDNESGEAEEFCATAYILTALKTDDVVKMDADFYGNPYFLAGVAKDSIRFANHVIDTTETDLTSLDEEETEDAEK